MINSDRIYITVEGKSNSPKFTLHLGDKELPNDSLSLLITAKYKTPEKHERRYVFMVVDILGMTNAKIAAEAYFEKSVGCTNVLHEGYVYTP